MKTLFAGGRNRSGSKDLEPDLFGRKIFRITPTLSLPPPGGGDKRGYFFIIRPDPLGQRTRRGLATKMEE